MLRDERSPLWLPRGQDDKVYEIIFLELNSPAGVGDLKI